MSARRQTISLPSNLKDLKQELRQNLTQSQKSIPSKWLYDATGSALFEDICDLPEYYLTRTETRILAEQAADMIAYCPVPLALVELGSGSSAKTRHLIDACLGRQTSLTYYPIDISPEALEPAADALLHDYERLKVVSLAGEFADGLLYLAQRPGNPRLVAFLGSTIGNLAEDELHDFLKMLHSHLRPADLFLLGFDLLKDASILIPAYDDAQGVTARFNLNLLERLNTEFQANFDLSSFEHCVVFNQEQHRIEMYLRSKRKQTVRIPGLKLELSFAKEETIHTENCYKHSYEEMEGYLKQHGFRVKKSFADPQNWFSVILSNT